MERRQNVRKIHLELRNQMSKDEVEDKSLKICQSLLASDWYQNETVFYLFYPLGNEVSLLPFFNQAKKDGKTIGFPRVKKDTMDFYKVEELSELEEGHFHVMEPKAHCERLEEFSPVVFVPGLVFDEKGNRYGYGKGFYDRYFSKYPSIEKRYAIAFEHQIEPELKVLATDVPMARIYTEKAVRMELETKQQGVF